MKTLVHAITDNTISIINQEYDINPNIQAYFTITKLTTKPMDNEDKLAVFNMLENVGFYNNIPKIRLKSTRMRDAIHILPKEIAKNSESSFTFN